MRITVAVLLGVLALAAVPAAATPTTVGIGVPSGGSVVESTFVWD